MENHTIKLRNGLQVYYREFTSTPLIGITLKIRLNFKEKNGLPHLVEHLLVHQVHIPSYITISGNTNTSCISIRILGNSKDCIAVLSLWLNQIIDLKNINQTNLDAEKDVVIQEIKQYKISNFEKFTSVSRNLAFERKNIFNDEVLGDINSIKKIEVKDIINFVNTHIVSNNISIFAAGNIEDIKRVLTILESLKIKSVFLGDGAISKSISFSTKKQIITPIDKSKALNLSIIYRIESPILDRGMVIAYSMLFSLLNEGKNSLLVRLHKVASELYFAQAIPIFKNQDVYIQVFTSCNYNDVDKIIEEVTIVLKELKYISSDAINMTEKNILFHQNLLFDGVENSLKAFSRMPHEQERILYLDDLNINKVLDSFNNLVRTIDNMSKSITIAQF